MSSVNYYTKYIFFSVGSSDSFGRCDELQNSPHRPCLLDDDRGLHGAGARLLVSEHGLQDVGTVAIADIALRLLAAEPHTAALHPTLLGFTRSPRRLGLARLLVALSEPLPQGSQHDQRDQDQHGPSQRATGGQQVALGKERPHRRRTVACTDALVQHEHDREERQNSGDHTSEEVAEVDVGETLAEGLRHQPDGQPDQPAPDDEGERQRDERSEVEVQVSREPQPDDDDQASDRAGEQDL